MEPVKTLILCGGKGSRSYPFTEYFPKVMMPIHGSPILVHLMRIYAEQGFRDFVLAAGHRKEMLYDYFHDRFTDWKIQIVDTGDESDTGERVRRCEPYLGDRFFATYGDGLGNLDLHDLLENHKQSRALGTLTSVPLRSQYGLVVFGKTGRVERFEEKPLIRDYWINAGFFVFEKDVFNHWGGSNLEQHVLPNLARQNQLNTYMHDGFWKSMDTSKDQQELEQLSDPREAVSPWMAPLGAKATGGN